MDTPAKKSPPYLLRCALVYAVALICSFGGYLEDGYPNDDGFSYVMDFRTWRLDAVTGEFRDPGPSVAERLMATIKGDVIRAHYVPTTTVFWHALYMVVGEDLWGASVMATGMLFHLLAAVMLLVMMTRLGMSPGLAFLGGLVYLLNPVGALGLSSSNGVIRLYGIALLFAATLLWDRDLPGKRLRPARLLLANLLFFLSLHANPTFFASSPLVIFFWAGLQWLGSRQPFWPWAKSLTFRGASFLVTFGLGVLTRLKFQGKMGTDHEFANRRIDAKSKTFFDGMWENFVELVPPAEGADDPAEGIPLPDGHGPDATAWILAAVGILVAAWGAWRIFRSRDPERPLITRIGLLRCVLLFGGFVLFLPYVYHHVRGDVFLHRYLYVGLPMAGVAASLVATLFLVPLAKPLGPKGLATLATLFVLALLPFYAEENAESVASVVYGKRAERVAAQAAAKVLATEPDILRVYFVDLPRTAGRAGMLFKRDDALRAALRLELWREHGLVVLMNAPAERAGCAYHGRTLLEHWPDLARHEVLRQQTAVLHFDPRTLDIRRVARFENRSTLTAPTALDFPTGPAPERFVVTGLESGRQLRPTTSFRRGADGSKHGTIRKRQEDLRLRPDAFLKLLDKMVKKYAEKKKPGQEEKPRSRFEATLVMALDSPAASIRRAAAEKLEELWELDDAKRRMILGSANLAHARAIVLTLEHGDAASDEALLLQAREREATRALACLVLQQRGFGPKTPEETRPDDPLPRMLFDEDVDTRALAVATFVRRRVPNVALLAGALLSDDRLSFAAHRRLREALISVADPAALDALLAAFVARRAQPDDLWALVDQLPAGEDSLVARQLLARALTTPEMRGALRRRLEADWKARVGEALSPSEAKGLFPPLGEAPDATRREGLRPKHYAAFPSLAWIALQESAIAEPMEVEDATLLEALSEDARSLLGAAGHLAAFRGRTETQPEPGLRVEFPIALPERSLGGAYGALLQLTNSGTSLPGGPGPLTPRIHLEWMPAVTTLPPTPATAQPLRLPLTGLAKGGTLSLPARIALPERPGIYDLAARIVQKGRDGQERVLFASPEKASLQRIMVGTLWEQR